jgi:hypothetical protein
METTMTKERPILFSGPLVRALLDGRKTQTRRVVKPQPTTDGYWWTWKHVSCNGESGLRDGLPCLGPCPYGFIGDRLWVRETWNIWRHDAESTWSGPINEARGMYASQVVYAADGRWQVDYRPSINMPRWASRITLEITDVRVQRLQDIDEQDAEAEGVEQSKSIRNANDPSFQFRDYMRPEGCTVQSAVDSFRTLWQSINGPDSWFANPWVWALTFRRIVAAASQ